LYFSSYTNKIESDTESCILAFNLQCWLQMEERTTVWVENRYFHTVLMARLCELTRLLQIKERLFFF